MRLRAAAGPKGFPIGRFKNQSPAWSRENHGTTLNIRFAKVVSPSPLASRCALRRASLSLGLGNGRYKTMYRRHHAVDDQVVEPDSPTCGVERT